MSGDEPPPHASGLPYRPCVGIMLLNEEGRVFTAKRIDNPADYWQMPQGGIDPGEEPRIAALRELEEETGIGAGKVEILAQSEGWLHYALPDALVGKMWKGRFCGPTAEMVRPALHRYGRRYRYPDEAPGI